MLEDVACALNAFILCRYQSEGEDELSMTTAVHLQACASAHVTYRDPMVQGEDVVDCNCSL